MTDNKLGRKDTHIKQGRPIVTYALDCGCARSFPKNQEDRFASIIIIPRLPLLRQPLLPQKSETAVMKMQQHQPALHPHLMLWSRCA